METTRHKSVQMLQVYSRRLDLFRTTRLHHGFRRTTMTKVVAILLVTAAVIYGLYGMAVDDDIGRQYDACRNDMIVAFPQSLPVKPSISTTACGGQVMSWRPEAVRSDL
jgi:hypothetical protein